MKLSDIGNLEKMAAEFKAIEELLVMIRDVDLSVVQIKLRASNRDAEATLSWNTRQTVPMEDFETALYEALKKVQDELRTKLAMCGVDDFTS